MSLWKNSRVLKWGYLEYMAYYTAHRDIKEVRSEYSRLRKIARRRLAQIEKSEYKDEPFIKRRKDSFVKLSDIATTGQLRRKLQELALFLSAETSTLQGLRARDRETITSVNKMLYNQYYTEYEEKYSEEAAKKASYKKIVKDKFLLGKHNVKQFYDFMDLLRTKKLDNIYDSERILDLMEQMEQKEINSDLVTRYFEDFVTNEEKLAKTRKPSKELKDSSKYWIKKLDIEVNKE